MPSTIYITAFEFLFLIILAVALFKFRKNWALLGFAYLYCFIAGMRVAAHQNGTAIVDAILVGFYIRLWWNTSHKKTTEP